MKQELRRSGVWESTEEALGIVGDGLDDEGDGEVGEEDGGVWIRRGSGEELVTIRGDRSVEHETKLSNARAVTKSNLDGAQHVAPLSNIKAGVTPRRGRSFELAIFGYHVCPAWLN